MEILQETRNKFIIYEKIYIIFRYIFIIDYFIFYEYE